MNRGHALIGTHVVIVLSYYGADDTMNCVASLVDGNSDAHVVVIDNGSFDGVVDRVRSRWPQVEIIQNPRNLGFAGGMNVGIRHAMCAGAQTITVLNNDTVVADGVTARLAAIAADGVAVSPEIRYLADPEQVWFAGGVLDVETSLARHLSEQEISEIPPDPYGLRRCEILAGCCVTASRETWDRVGLFDERYFLNFEDSDWSLRAEAAGVRLVVDTTVCVQHKVSASFHGAYTYLGLYFYTRNGLMFGYDHGRGVRTATSLRYVRRHVLPALKPVHQSGDVREIFRKSVMIGCAIADHLRRRYGPAPRFLEDLAGRWS